MVTAIYCRLFNGIGRNQSAKSIAGNTIELLTPYSSQNNAYKTLWTLGGGNKNRYGTSDTANVFVDVGFDDTAETPNDWKLGDGNCKGDGQSFTISPLTPLGSSRNVSSDREFFNVNQSFRNDTASDITVKEVGVIGNCHNNTDYGTLCLLCRKVLDTPLVMKPGESYNFNYRLRIKDT